MEEFKVSLPFFKVLGISNKNLPYIFWLDVSIHLSGDFYYIAELKQLGGKMTAENETPLGISTNASLFNYIGIGVVVIAIGLAATIFAKYKNTKKHLGDIEQHQSLVTNNKTDEILTILKTRHAPIHQTTFTCQDYSEYVEE